MKQRYCKTCEEMKPESEFGRTLKTKNNPSGGLRRICKSCSSIRVKAETRKYNARKYGCNDEIEKSWIEHKKEFGEMCRVCGCPEDADHKRSLSYDHNHFTGEYRGFLCGKCNAGIGSLKDSPGVLIRGAIYLLDRGHYGPVDSQSATLTELLNQLTEVIDNV